LLHHDVLREPFRTELYACLTARADALFEFTDVVLWADWAVKTLVGPPLAPEHRQGRGVYMRGCTMGGYAAATTAAPWTVAASCRLHHCPRSVTLIKHLVRGW
jgi:hypothetical protein